MNTSRRNLLAATLALFAWTLAPAAQPKVGDLFPKLADFNLEGTLPDLTGKVVLVDFWASWCGPCRHSFPALQQVHEKFKDQGVIVIGISLDEDKSDMDGFVTKSKVTFPILRDAKSKLADKLDVSTIPASFLIDSSGKIVAIHNGYEGEKTKREYMSEIGKLLPSKSAQ